MSEGKLQKKKLFDGRIILPSNSFMLIYPFSWVIGSLNQYVQQGHRKQRCE